MRKSNNAFYQSDPDFSNDSEPRRKEVDAYMPKPKRKIPKPPDNDNIIEYKGLD